MWTNATKKKVFFLWLNRNINKQWIENAAERGQEVEGKEKNVMALKIDRYIPVLVTVTHQFDSYGVRDIAYIIKFDWFPHTYVKAANSAT